MEDTEYSVFFDYKVLTGIFIGVCGLLFCYIIKVSVSEEKKDDENEIESQNIVPSQKKKESSTHSGKSKKKSGDNRWPARGEKSNYSHPWLMTTLKGHEAPVLDMDFSSNGKYLVSSADDCTVMLWDVKDLTQKNRKSVKCNIRDHDVASLVRWSPDNKGFIVKKVLENECEAYKLEKNNDGSIIMNAQGITSKVMPYHKEFVNDTIIGLAIACSGKFVITCSARTLIVWDPKGKELSRINTGDTDNHCAKISPCGRFIVICCNADKSKNSVKIWEVIFNAMGEFEEVKWLYGLNAKNFKVDANDVAFDQDSSHMAVVSKSGKLWELFYTNVEFRKGVFLRSKIDGTYPDVPGNPKIALSPTAEVLAVAASNTLTIYSTLDATSKYTIEDIGIGDISSVMFDSAGKYILASVDKYIRVFHNVTGYRCNIISAQQKLKDHQTSATKERLQKLIKESQTFLKKFDENIL